MLTAHVNGIDIAYSVTGQGETLVLIMGLGGAKESWFLQTRAFKKRYQVVTFDNRAVGHTRDDGEPFSIRDMADDTVGLMDFLGIRQAHVLGYSLGGVVAQELAMSYPERLKKLILASTMPVGALPGEAALQTARALGLERWARPEDLGEEDLARMALAITELSFNKPLVRAAVRLASLSRIRRQGATSFARQMRAPVTSDTVDRLGSIRAPTLVITGADDQLVPPLASEVLASRIPSARLIKIEGGSHAMLLEMAHQFNREVLDFLAAQ